MKYLVLLAICCLFWACPSKPSGGADPTADLPTDGPPIIAIGKKVVRSGLMPFGINLCQYSDYGTGQIRKNLVSRNPGFEGWEYRSIVEVEEKTLLGFRDVGPPGAWMDGFWDGAKYEVIWGQAVGQTGVIREFKRGESGNTYNCDKVTPFAKGDQVVLRMSRDNNPTGGWWPNATGGARFESALPRPESEGRQSLYFNCMSKGVLTLHSYFDPPIGEGQPLVPLRGKYVLSFWAKGSGAMLQAELRRLTTPNHTYFDQSFSLSSTWTHYTYPFTAEDGNSMGVVDLAFMLEDGEAWLDDVAIYSEETGPEGFDNGVLRALSELKPGIVRAWGGQLGQSLTNMLAGPESRRLTGYSRWSQEPKVIGYSLHEVLQLCQSLGCEAWYVVPLTLSPQERRDLVEYLCGGEETPMGALRKQLGQAKPWSHTLSKIYLEFGNEAWNGIFKGSTLERPEVYGKVCADFAAQLRAAPGFDPTVIKLVVGGQSVNKDRNKAILAQAGTPDVLAIAPYLMYKMDQPSTPNEPFVRLAAEVDSLPGTYLQANLDMLADQAHRPEFAVYEVNLHTTDGNADEQTLNNFVTSAGAATSLGAHMMNMQRMGIGRQCFYTLNQFDFRRVDKKTVRLWGLLRELQANGRKRPAYHVLRLLNQVLRGEMIEVAVGGAPLTFGLGQHQVNQALAAYCTRQGSNYNLIVINLDPGQAHSFRVRLPGPVDGQVGHRFLKFSQPLQGNEKSDEVGLDNALLPTMPEELSVAPSGLSVWSFVIE